MEISFPPLGKALPCVVGRNTCRTGGRQQGAESRWHRGQRVVVSSRLPASPAPAPRPLSVGGVHSGHGSLPASADGETESWAGPRGVLGVSSEASSCLARIRLSPHVLFAQLPSFLPLSKSSPPSTSVQCGPKPELLSPSVPEPPRPALLPAGTGLPAPRLQHHVCSLILVEWVHLPEASWDSVCGRQTDLARQEVPSWLCPRWLDSGGESVVREGTVALEFRHVAPALHAVLAVVRAVCRGQGRSPLLPAVFILPVSRAVFVRRASEPAAHARPGVLQQDRPSPCRPPVMRSEQTRAPRASFQPHNSGQALKPPVPQFPLLKWGCWWCHLRVTAGQPVNRGRYGPHTCVLAM